MPETASPPVDGQGPTLTERQREVLGLLGMDKSPQEIAKSLGVSESMVRQHMNNLRKLGLIPSAAPKARRRRRTRGPQQPRAEAKKPTALRPIASVFEDARRPLRDRLRELQAETKQVEQALHGLS